MIGRNETASKKARFWQSFVRSLKGKILYDLPSCTFESTRTWYHSSASDHHSYQAFTILPFSDTVDYNLDHETKQQNDKLNTTTASNCTFINMWLHWQDRKTSGQRKGTDRHAAACSPSCYLARTRTASPSTTTPPSPPRGSPSPDTATCPSTARPTATPPATSTLTTTPALSIGTGQVSERLLISLPCPV